MKQIQNNIATNTPTAKSTKIDWYQKRGIKETKGTPITNDIRLSASYRERITRFFGNQEKVATEKIMLKLKELGYNKEQLPLHLQEMLLNEVSSTLSELKEDTKLFAEITANRYVESVDISAKAKTNRSVEHALGVDPKLLFTSDKVKGKITTAISENVSLIKGLGDDIYKKIDSIVNISTTEGAGAGQIYKELLSIEEMTSKRAKLIAYDQTRKITQQLSRQRMQDAGITHFEWLHSGGGIPRKEHKELNGKIFPIDDPPVIDKKNNIKGYPSQLINCKCQMIPVIDIDNYTGDTPTSGKKNRRKSL